LVLFVVVFVFSGWLLFKVIFYGCFVVCLLFYCFVGFVLLFLVGVS